MTSTRTQNQTRHASHRIIHRDYCRQRSRQIAYGRWHPWTDAEPVRDHVRELRESGASYRAIADAAQVSPSTVHGIMTGRTLDRIHASQARRLLAVRTGSCGDRRNACGSRRRIQALVALGHPRAELARQLGISKPSLGRLLRGETQHVSTAVHRDVCGLYDKLWSQLPHEHTGRQQYAAESARHRAEAAGWLPPMALDDDKIDESSYRPRTKWRRATGVSS